MTSRSTQTDCAAQADAAPKGIEHLCPRCFASVLMARHCKNICESCGYVESCEDLFAPIAEPASKAR